MDHDIAPLFAMLMIFGIPIIAILTSHQRKMAQILHDNARQAAAPSAETQMLREEIRELKALVYQQAIALDNLGRPSAEVRVKDRVGA